MRNRSFVVGILALVVLISGVILINKAKKNEATNLAPTPSTAEKIAQKFGNLSIPSNADRADLNDVSGGLGLGEAIRVYQNGKFELTVLADLPTPAAGYFYQAWIVKDDNYVSIGRLKVAKGGYVADFSSGIDYSDYKGVIVTLEKTSDLKPETQILVGSF